MENGVKFGLWEGQNKPPPHRGAPCKAVVKVMNNWNVLMVFANVCHPEGTNVTEGSQGQGRTYSDAADCCSILEILRLRLRSAQDDRMRW